MKMGWFTVSKNVVIVKSQVPTFSYAESCMVNMSLKVAEDLIEDH